MAENLKILAQSSPAATTLTSILTVGAGKSVSISTISVCNTTNAAKTFRISVAIAGAADTTAQYVCYDQSLDAYSTYTLTLGMTLAATDVLRVYASALGVSFNVFGVEVI